MKLLANENFPLKSIRFLQSKGFDIIGIGIDFSGYTDDEVMKLAIREKRIILTFDRDYGELIFKYNYRPEKGVIYLRLSNYAPDEPGKIIHNLLKKEKIITESFLTVFNGTSLRQRKF